MTTTDETPTAPVVDPMDEDVSQIDISFPRLAANVYELNVDAAEKVDNKAGTGQNLKVSTSTVTETLSTQGEKLPAGVKLTAYISLTETPNYSENSIKKAVAQFMLSAGLTGGWKAFLANPSVAVGKHVTAKVGIQKETDEYPESNTIKAFVVKK